MKNNEVWEGYARYTDTISETGRKLGFAAAALCWALRPTTGWTPGLFIVVRYVIAFFVVDMAQSIGAAIVRRLWIESQERRCHKVHKCIDHPDFDYAVPQWLDWWATGCMILKVLLLATAYAALWDQVS